MVVLSEVAVDIVAAEDEARFRALMQTHHYLGAVPGMGETVRYVAHHRGRWLALAVFSAPALKCGARDRWIGWDRGVQFGRLHLVTNNSRFLILPGGERNLGSRVLSLCTRRLVRDWPARFAHEVLLAETFVDPELFQGTVYRAANWIEVGRTRGFARGGAGYSEHARPKLVFLHPLCRGARARLGAADLDPRLRHGVPKMTLTAAQMRSLPEFFLGIDDPRRRQGRRHALPTVLALAAAATLCGMRGYKAIGEWVDDLSPRVLQRFRVRRRHGQYRPPSLSAMRSLLIRVDPAQLDAALRAWHEAHGSGDSALAIDGKTIRGAIDNDGTQAHVLGIVGHETKAPWGQKIGMRPDADDGEKRTNEIGTVIPLLETLNADLRQAERWDDDAIRARGARLADDAVGIWKRPVLPDRVLEPYRTPRAGAGRYTIEHHPHLRPGAPMHDLFEAVRQEILGLAPEVREEFTRHYVAYKTQTNFTDIVPRKRRLLLTLNMRFDEISDPRGLAADITNLGLWGNGDVQLEVDNARQVPYAMELVRQALAAKQPDGAKGSEG